MDARERRTAIVLTGAALALVVCGQAYFIWRRAYVWDGLLFLCLGVLLWVAALRQVEARPRQPFLGIVVQPVRAALMASGGLLVVGASVAAVRNPPETDFTPHLIAWGTGLVLFVSAHVPLPERGWGRWLIRQVWAHRVEMAGLGGLLSAALLVRLVSLETAPANFGGDEGTQALAAMQLVEPPLGNPFSTGWYSVPTMSFLAYGLAMRVFGFSVAGARALSALIGTATVLTTFLLARDVAGRWVGWAAAALVAFGHYGVHFSRLASNQVADGLFVTLALYLLRRGLAERSGSERGVLLLALAGVVVGGAWYGYFGARLATLLVGMYLAWRALVEPRFLARNRQGLLRMATGALLAVSPLALHLLAHPVEFLSRYNQVSIFASGWLEREIVITGRSAASLLLQQFWKSVSAFNFTPDPTFWYRPGTPMLDPVSGVLFILGLTVATVRARRPGHGLLLIWFWSFILLGWTLTENPPSSQRGVGAIPVVAILAGLGLVEVVGLTRRLTAPAGAEPSRHLGRMAVGWVLAMIAVVNLGFYFGVYTPRRVYGNPTAEVADVLCDVLEARQSFPPVYFDGAPVMYWDFGAIAFRLRQAEGRDFSPDGGVEVALSQGALFVILAENISHLERIQAAFPDGVGRVFYSDADGRPLFVLYEVPPRRSR